jgi:hypothetical protein
MEGAFSPRPDLIENPIEQELWLSAPAHRSGTYLIIGGHLIIGKDESLPLTYPTLFVPIFSKEKIYQKFIPE